MMRRIAVLFPGIGYTCEKPLLYYSWKLAGKMGYEVRPVPYQGFESGIKGNEEKMEKAFRHALKQSEKILKDVEWDTYDEILFVSKSVGTAVSAAYAKKYGLNVRNILFTPLAQTFRFAKEHCIAFHGTSDPWADTQTIVRSCEEQNIPLYLTEGANHSLETGEILKDIAELQCIMKKVEDYLCTD